MRNLSPLLMALFVGSLPVPAMAGFVSDCLLSIRNALSGPSAEPAPPSIELIQHWKEVAQEPLNGPNKFPGAYFSSPALVEGSEVQTVSRIMLLGRNGEEIGQVIYHHVDRNTLKIDLIRVAEGDQYRKKGLAKALYARVLLEHPEVSRLTGRLESTNIEIYEAGISKGLSTEDSIKTTPAYAIRKALGFNKIVWKSLRDSKGTSVSGSGMFKTVTLTMERE